MQGIKSKVLIGEKSVRKSYTEISNEAWDRIKAVALDFSHHKIGPKVLNVDDLERSIEYQIIDMIMPNMSRDKLIEAINEKIDLMHNLDYAHGDLHLDNVGFVGEEIFFIDHDSVYRISEGPVDWVRDWMKSGFDWKGTFEEFVAHDYVSWTYELEEEADIDN